MLGDDALGCLRDLKRWLKLYDEKTNRLDVARCLAEAKLITGDLVPILSLWTEEKTADKAKSRLALECLKLLVPLTWPIDNVGEMTVNHHRHTPYIQQAQVAYKAALLHGADGSVLSTAVRIALPSISTARDERTTRDDGIIKLMLYLMRNVAAISPQPNLPNLGLDNEISRSATIEAFRHQNVFALILTICSNIGDEFNLQDVIVLEILFNLVRGVDVESLWMTEQQVKVKKTNDLKNVLVEEKGMNRDYQKIAPTRHGRFGTMIWVKGENERNRTLSGQDNFKDGFNALQNIDKTKKWNKPQQRRKDIDHSIHDFVRSVKLSTNAAELLRNFAEEFLDSGFNPLFVHLRKAIEREAERILDINYRQYFYVVSWFLQAERSRRERKRKDRQAKVQQDFEPEDYGLVAGVLNQEMFITLNRYMQQSLDNKEWQDMSAAMRCFTQVLLTVQDMTQSPLEDDQEIADNIQSRIFYEETTHDRIVSILKGYKDQGFGYLDAATELSHVFLRMLERYSKENTDLQIRSRRRARKKKKKARKEAGENENEPDADNASEHEDAAEIAQVSKERKFDFTRFCAKFTSQSSVNTIFAFTNFYRDLSVEQLKRAHRFFYRVAFKQNMAVLLYRVDIIALFYKIVKGPGGLDVSHTMYKEWSELIRQVLKSMFKKLDQRPELMIEMLFSKINATLYYLEYGQEKQTASVRPPVELEIKPVPGIELADKIGIVVAALIQDDEVPLVTWLKLNLKRAADDRLAWEQEQRAREADNVILGDMEKPNIPRITARPGSEEIRNALFKNARLRLLMSLVGLQRLGDEDEPGVPWIFPSEVSGATLQQNHDLIEQYEKNAWTNELGDEEPTDLIRRVRNVTITSNTAEGEGPERGFLDDSDEEAPSEDFEFGDNIKTKSSAAKAVEKLKKSQRKRKRAEGEELADDILEARRKAREEAALERRRKIKSDIYINDSDEEMTEEERKAFFTREEEARKRQDQRVRKALMLESTEDTASKPRRKKRRASVEDGSSEDDNSDILINLDAPSDQDEETVGGDTASSQLIRDASEEEPQKTPLSSPASHQSPGLESPSAVSKELSQPRTRPVVNNTSSLTKNSPENLASGSIPDVPPARRRARAGFIFDSDDDE